MDAPEIDYRAELPPDSGWTGMAELDVTADASVASGFAPSYFRDVSYHGTALRLYTQRLSSPGDGLVRTARPLTEANATIGRERRIPCLILVSMAVSNDTAFGRRSPGVAGR